MAQTMYAHMNKQERKESSAIKCSPDFTNLLANHLSNFPFNKLDKIA
jgi:hypothetical protein